MIISEISKYTNVKFRMVQFYARELGLSHNGGGRGNVLDFKDKALCRLIGAVFLYKAGLRLDKIKLILDQDK